MPERLECEVLQKVRYINTLTFTFYLFYYTLELSPSKTVKYSSAHRDFSPSWLCFYSFSSMGDQLDEPFGSSRSLPFCFYIIFMASKIRWRWCCQQFIRSSFSPL